MNHRLGMVSSEPHGDEPCSAGLVWQGKRCYHQEHLWVPQIYEGAFPFPHQGFNAVCLQLDGRMQAEMRWEAACAEARKLISEGIKILWILDLGLFTALPQPLSDPTQMRALVLAIDHFSEAIWTEFGAHSLGVCFYEGFLDLTDAQLEYLDLLAQYLPVDVECFVKVDAGSLKSPLAEAWMRSRERSDRIRFMVKNSLLPPQDLLWGAGGSPYGFISERLEAIAEEKLSGIGICLPQSDDTTTLESLSVLEEAFSFLMSRNIPYRIVHEAYLTTEWECLDFLMVSSENISSMGMRKLQGFCAAGGTVVTLGPLLGLAQEISFEEWKSENLF